MLRCTPPTDSPQQPGPDAPAEQCRPQLEKGEVCVHGFVVHPLRATPAEPGPGPVTPLRVLIADDYVDAAESLAMLLAQVGIETQVATGGEQALERAGGWRPQVCVLDIDMPDLDGREVARRIRAQGWEKRPLLIALTGWTSSQDQRKALDAGFYYYLIKPVEPSRLVRIIQSAAAGMPST